MSISIGCELPVEPVISALSGVAEEPAPVVLLYGCLFGNGGGGGIGTPATKRSSRLRTAEDVVPSASASALIVLMSHSARAASSNAELLGISSEPLIRSTAYIYRMKFDTA